MHSLLARKQECCRHERASILIHSVADVNACWQMGRTTMMKLPSPRRITKIGFCMKAVPDLSRSCIDTGHRQTKRCQA